MAILRNIPTFFKVIGTISSLDSYHVQVDEAAASGDREEERRIIGEDLKLWAGNVAETFDITVEVEGAEKVPEDDGFVLISNHQGYADIIALLKALNGRQLGFIAKDTLEKVPYLGKWIKRIRGIFIKRGDTRSALKSMREGVELVKQGYNLAIFPEGTRSRGPVMGEFKPGSFKLATKAKAPILPVSISGSYKCFEELGYHQPATIHVTFHDPVITKDLDRKALIRIESEIPEIIRRGIEK